MGQDVQTIFDKYATDTPVFTAAGTEDFVKCDLIMRINARSFCQNARQSCGPTSVAQVAAQSHPLEFAEYVTEVYFTGKISKINYTMSSYLPTLDFEEDHIENMMLGSNLIWTSALRDARNQALTKIDPSTVPTDGYNKIRAKPFFLPKGSSFLSTSYDVQFFYELFDYKTDAWVGTDNVCPACVDTIYQMFPADLAALTGIINGTNATDFPWSPRTQAFLASPNKKEALYQYNSRLSADGLKFGCDHTGPVSICVNMGYSDKNDTTCNENFCTPQHWVKLDSCDLANDICNITSFGNVETLSCEQLGNFTQAVVRAHARDSNDGDEL